MKKKLYVGQRYLCEVSVADTFLKRFLGYMFRKKPHHQTLMIKPCNSIHTFFMGFDIDVLFVNRDFVVVKKLETLGPGKVILPVHGAVAVFETIAGGFSSISNGDIIMVKNEE